MKEKIFVVVLNWNGAQETLSCLKSLEKASFSDFDFKVIVVDNGSDDDLVERLSQVNFRFDYELIKNHKNLGFAGGNNVGLDLALRQGADYVMVLNNDTLVDPSFLVHLAVVLRSEKNAGVVSPKIYFASGFEFHKNRYRKSELGKIIWYAGGKIDWANVIGINEGVDEVDCGQFSHRREVDFATGCCSLFSAKALRKVGLFDERYFLYFEDVDLSVRLKRGGFGIFFEPQGIIWHKVARSSGIGSDLNDYFISRNRLLFGFKYAPVRVKGALLKESVKFLVKGRPWQKQGVKDFYLGRLGLGSWHK